MKKQLLTIALLIEFVSLKAQISVPNGSVSSTTNNSGNTAGYVGIGNTAPLTLLDIKTLGTSAVIRAGATANNSVSNSSLELGYYTGTVFTQMGSIGFSNYPACGSGVFKISSGSAFVAMSGSKIGFNETPFLCYSPSALYGDFSFNGLIGTRSLLVGNFSGFQGQGGTPDLSLLAGYIFGVNGNAYASGTMVIGGRPTIGTTGVFSKGFPAGYKLYVSDGILTEKVKVSVKTSAEWSDYVFAPEYKLTSLSEVENYVKLNKHLPGVPSAEEIVKTGIDLGKMDAKLLEKIEELTLYMIELKKEVASLKAAKTETGK